MSDNMLPVGTRIAEFEIRGLIGEGGFGIVYLAFDHSLEREVAFKEYMPAAIAARGQGNLVSVRSEHEADTFQAGLKSFVNEARLLAQFDHPALVKVYRFWEGNGTAYMVMPLYKGRTLKETLRGFGAPPDEKWLKTLLEPLLDALDYIHCRQCFHRDIAPDNILILEDGNPVLLDFGAARRVIAGMTQALTVIFKPGFAPVEQYSEITSMKQGAWTDIYALASVIYYAAAGKAPTAAVSRIMTDSMIPFSKVAAGRFDQTFLSGIDRALAVKPEDRPQSIAEFRQQVGLNKPEPSLASAVTVSRVEPAAAQSTIPDIREEPTTVITVRKGGTRDFEPTALIEPQTSPHRAPQGVSPAVKRQASWMLPAIAALGVSVVAGIAYVLYERDQAPLPATAPDTSTPQSQQAQPSPPQAPTPEAAPAAPAPAPAPATMPAPTETAPPPAPRPEAVAPPSPEPEAAPAPAVTQPAARKDKTGAESGSRHESRKKPRSGSNIGAAGAPIESSAGETSTRNRPDPSHCAALLQRASLGDPLSATERTTLTKDCK